FEEQFPWVDLHPAAATLSPRARERDLHIRAPFKATNRRLLTQWQRGGMQRLFGPDPHLLFSLSLGERVARSDGMSASSNPRWRMGRNPGAGLSIPFGE